MRTWLGKSNKSKYRTYTFDFETPKQKRCYGVKFIIDALDTIFFIASFHAALGQEIVLRVNWVVMLLRAQMTLSHGDLYIIEGQIYSFVQLFMNIQLFVSLQCLPSVQQQLMKQILNLLILLFCVLSLAHTKFEPTQSTAVPNGVQDIEYSPDQKIVIFSTSKFAQVHDGVTTAFRSNLTFTEGLTFSSLSFSQDSSKYAIGFSSQDGLSHYRIDTAQIGEYKSPGNSGSVNSLCFSADNKNLVMGTQKGDIYVVNELNETSSFSFGVPITSVACAPYRSLQFSVAGGNNVTQKKLSTFNFNPVTKQISQIKVYDINKDDWILDLIYTSSGTEIMYCGNSTQIYIKSIDENQGKSIVWPAQYVNLHKIRSSLKGDIIAATTGKGKLVIQKTTPGQNAVQVQQFAVSVPRFGLGPSGANAAYINTNNTGSVLGQCPNGQYLNDADDTCSSCNPECSQCLSLPTSCYSCNDGHYLTQSYQCLNCVARCKTCSNGQVCQICNDPFTVTGLGCGCKLGTFIDNDKCTTCTEGCLDCSDLNNCKQCDSDYELVNGFCNSNGFPTWAVVLLVILGITVIAAVAGVAYLKFKRSQKQSPLLNDQQETPEKQTA